MSGRAINHAAPETAPANSPRAFIERRREPRFPSDAIPARVWIGARSIAARVLDISTSGIRLEVPTSLPVHAETTVHFNNIIAAGQIRYCRLNRNDSFDIGLRIEDVIAAV